MLIYIDPLLLNLEQNFRNLDKLLFMIEDGKHTLLLRDNDEENIMESAWLESQGDRVKQSTYEIILKLLTATAYNSTSAKQRIPVTINSLPNDNSNLENSLKRLEDPLIILMENSTSDGTFLNCICRCFKNQSKQIQKALGMGWLEYVQAGGITQIIPVINHYNKKKTAPYTPRIFVIIDSNKLHPADERGEVKAVVDFCADNGIPCMSLYKREIENYLPLNVLSSHFEEGDLSYNAFISLTHDQMDFYDLDKGFNGKNEYPEGQQELFEGLKDADFKALRQGISIAKADLYRLFNDVKIVQVELLNRCTHQPEPLELKNILFEIESNL